MPTPYNAPYKVKQREFRDRALIAQGKPTQAQRKARREQYLQLNRELAASRYL